MTFHVATYNLLAQELAGASWFSHCNASALEEEHRYETLISRHLSSEVSRGAIICLQELTRGWAQRLHVYFAEHNYALVASHYGYTKNGYMGVAVAYPRDSMRLRHVALERVGDFLYSRRKLTRRDLDSDSDDGKSSKRSRSALSLLWTRVGFRLVSLALWLLSFFVMMARRLGIVGAGERTASAERVVDPWHESVKRQNVVVLLELEIAESGRRVCVATYHMPCAFWSPPTMVLHAGAVAQLCASIAAERDAPLVLCGDWNFTPTSTPYELVTHGVVDIGNPDLPTPCADPTVFRIDRFEHGPLTSAYWAVNGREPDFTNYSQTYRDDEPFIDTLDYIFFDAKQLHATAVASLPDRSQVDGPCPTLQEPSDHIKLSASFQFQ
jgi:mRNA deadenylase 3'-5' endonuclease subunit Ccr4